MVYVKEPFFLWLLSVTTLEQWGVDKRGIAEVSFAYLNIISANFQLDPHSHLAGYHTHINKYINTTSSISIRFFVLFFFHGESPMPDGIIHA